MLDRPPRDLPSHPKPSPCPAALALSSVVCNIRIAERPQASPLQPHELHLTWYIRARICSSNSMLSVGYWANTSCLPQLIQRKVRTYPWVFPVFIRKTPESGETCSY